MGPGFKAELKDADRIKTFMEEWEFRTTAFIKEYIGLIAEDYKNQIYGRYSSLRDETANEIAENLEVMYLSEKVESKKDQGGDRKETKIEEQYSAAVVVNAIKRDSSDFDKASMVIKVQSNRRSKRQMPGEVFVLLRYGPWHLDELPFVPDPAVATMTFIQEDPKKVIAIKKLNKRNKARVRKELSRFNVKYTSRDDVIKNLSGYDDMEYWILRKEFGLDGRKMPVWKPALKYVMKKGYEKVFYKNVNLYKTLADPDFKGYKNFGRKYKILPKGLANDFEKFQKRIRG